MLYLFKCHPFVTFTVVSALLTLLVALFDLQYDVGPWNVLIFFPAYLLSVPFQILSSLVPYFEVGGRLVVAYGLGLALALGLDQGWRALWRWAGKPSTQDGSR
ncbi:MAG: hypothetical protein AAGK14_04245 [Verrucomicrobiota bacterium]